MIVFSTTSAGAFLSFKLREKMLICRELVSLCDIISIDISFRKNSVLYLIENNGFEHLSFITADCITDGNALNSPLGSEENKELARFLFSLGKTDAKTQLKMIEGFKSYISLCAEKYSKRCEKDSKIYIVLGLFCGLIISFTVI